MSFILESIKKAERERKLGQQAPSISIEYTGEHFDQGGLNWLQWALLSLGIIVTAIVVWGATFYFTNKDQQYIQQISETKVSSNEDQITETITVASRLEDIPKREIAMVPVKNIHQSNLKTVKLISEEDEVSKLQVYKVKTSNPQQSIVAERTEPEIKKPSASVKPKLKASRPLLDVKPDVVKKANQVASKQGLVSIYSELAELAETQQEPVASLPTLRIEEVEEELVEIKTANYVTSEVSQTGKSFPKTSQQEVSVAHKTAVSTGVPSFGELPYDIQEQIPDFDVSVHMFHADPSQRRIRINGNMYTEGKNLQQDLALVEITRYGAVFDYQGHLFRLNVR